MPANQMDNYTTIFLQNLVITSNLSLCNKNNDNYYLDITIHEYIDIYT